MHHNLKIVMLILQSTLSQVSLNWRMFDFETIFVQKRFRGSIKTKKIQRPTHLVKKYNKAGFRWFHLPNGQFRVDSASFWMVSGGFKSIIVSICTEVKTKTHLLIKTFAKEIMTQKRRDTSKKTINAASHLAG